jgi:hypothetical protein
MSALRSRNTAYRGARAAAPTTLVARYARQAPSVDGVAEWGDVLEVVLFGVDFDWDEYYTSLERDDRDYETEDMAAEQDFWERYEQEEEMFNEIADRREICHPTAHDGKPGVWFYGEGDPIFIESPSALDPWCPLDDTCPGLRAQGEDGYNPFLLCDTHLAALEVQPTWLERMDRRFGTIKVVGGVPA